MWERWWKRDIDIEARGAARAMPMAAACSRWGAWCGECSCTVWACEQREVGRVARDGRLAAHVVMVVALRWRRRHEGRRRRQARRPAPRAARERVHGGERADVAHARGALAGRLRPVHDRYAARSPHRARSSIAARPPRLSPAHAPTCFVLNF